MRNHALVHQSWPTEQVGNDAVDDAFVPGCLFFLHIKSKGVCVLRGF